MAGGWTRDGAVQDQIDDTVKDAILRARALTPFGRQRRRMRRLRRADPEKAARRVARRADLRRLPERARQGGRALDHQPPRQQG